MHRLHRLASHPVKSWQHAVTHTWLHSAEGRGQGHRLPQVKYKEMQRVLTGPFFVAMIRASKGWRPPTDKPNESRGRLADEMVVTDPAMK